MDVGEVAVAEDAGIEMGLEGRDVRRIMGVTQEAIHTLLLTGKGYRMLTKIRHNSSLQR